VSRVADSFSTATDPGIRQLRTALQQEGAALAAITEAMANTRRSAGAAAEANLSIADLRDNLLRSYQSVAAARQQAVEQMRKAGTAWDDYYQALANPPAVEPTSAAVTRTPGQTGESLRTSQPTLPLIRYTGDWIFPANGTFFGTRPASAEVSVREASGRITGTLDALFNAPASVTPQVRLTFEGNLTGSRNQTFELRTSDGLAGTIELIPGPAFNLLEVNFQLGLIPNRIRHGNFILLKK